MLEMSAEIIKNNYSKYYSASVMDKYAIEMAQKTFAIYSSQGIIRNSCFDDNVWVLFDEVRTTQLNFNLSENTEDIALLNMIDCSEETLVKYLKVYLVSLMGKLGLLSLRDTLKYIKDFIITADIESALNRNISLTHIAGFLKALPYSTTSIDSLIEKTEDAGILASKHKDKRILAEFKQYFMLDEALNVFWKQAPEHDKLFFFPVWLWWELTAILPLRPTEFLLIPRNCLERAEEEYKLTVRRSARKGNSDRRKRKMYHIDDDYDLYTYTISDKIANAIKWYIDSTNNDYRSSINTLFSITPHWRYLEHTMPVVATYYTYSYMSKCLSEFRRSFMCIESEMNPIHLGDTRHIAMIGLIISGGSPSICRELAGHDDISISSHYYSNISRFVECSVYEFSRKHVLYPLEIISCTHVVQNKARTPVGDGYCNSNEYAEGRISDCLRSIGSMGEIGECRRCIYFIDGKTGRYRVLADTHERKQDVDNDSKMLISAIERVRKGIGFKEELESCIMKLQNSIAIYAQSLMNAKMKEDNDGTSEKNGY